MPAIATSRLRSGGKVEASIEELQRVTHLRIKGENQRDRKAKIKLDQYVTAATTSFGSNKYGDEYTMRVRSSMDRYKRIRHDYLHAIVMPSGHGKTTLANRYGVIDVDNLVSKELHNKLVDWRVEILTKGESWRDHNQEWFNEVNSTLNVMVFTKPTVILVHTEETALEIGAKIIGGVCYTKQGLENSISNRSNVGKHFARLNLYTVQGSRVFNPIRCTSPDEIESAFLMMMNENDLAVGAPNMYSNTVWNRNYASYVPRWVLEGDMPCDFNLLDVITMFAEGQVPKECVDYYVRCLGLDSAQGFGVTMNDWAKVCAQISFGIGEPKGELVTNDYLHVNEQFPFRSKMEQLRANMTMRRMVKVFDIWSHEDCRDIARYHIGDGNTFVTGILLHWKGLMQHSKVHHVIRNWYKVSYNEWSDTFKLVHNYVRTSNWLFDMPLTENVRQNMMYMDLLVGRTQYKLTTEMATEGRVGNSDRPLHVAYNPENKQWSIKEYERVFNKALDNAMTKIKYKPRKVNVDTFMDFWALRRSWLTKGSLVFNTIDPELKNYISLVYDDINAACRELKARHNKASLFEVSDLIDVISGKPELFNMTKMAPKWETGFKFRVLLPGSLEHYLVFSYVLYIAEAQPQIGSVRLNSPPDEQMVFFDNKMTKGLVHMLYDWKDFNTQHSSYEMCAVVKKLRDIPTKPKDYDIFVSAIASSMYDMWLKTDDGIFKLSNGLFSGWRGTTWINSWLNYAYLYCAFEVYQALFPTLSLQYIDHGGDDVDLAFLEHIDAVRFLCVMNLMKFDATKIKQMIADKAEFFRNTVDWTGVYASCTRALCAFTSGDWEGSQRATVKERVTSTLDQIAKLERRGLNKEVAKGCALATLSHWCRVKDGEEWLNLPDEILHGAPESGGLGIPDRDGNVYVLTKPIPDFIPTSERRIVPGFKSSLDYVKHLEVDFAKRGLNLARAGELAERMAEDNFQFNETADHQKWVEIMNDTYIIQELRPVVTHRDDMASFVDMLEADENELDNPMFGIAAKYAEYSDHIEHNGRALTKDEVIAVVTYNTVNPEVLEFKGNLYYRRLIPDFMAYKITNYCKTKLNEYQWTMETAEDKFEVMCSMASRYFNHYM